MKGKEPSEQISPHFKRHEFACKDQCGYASPSLRLIDLLERARGYYNAPLVVTSGCRCEAHNRAVGGGSRSAHLTGEAADISCVASSERFDLLSALLRAGARRVGLGEGFVHVDVSETLVQDVAWLYPVKA